MKYLSEIDAARGFFIILVVAIHVASFMIWYNPNPNIDTYFWFFAFGKFSVPGFVLLSGLVLSYSYRNKAFSYSGFLKGRLAYIVVPYLVWSGIYFTFKTPETITAALIMLAQGKAMFHLYFIVIIFQFYLLLPLFLKLTNAIPFSIFATLGLALQLAAFDYLPSLPTFKPLTPSAFVFWFYVFTIGLYFGKHYEAVMRFVDKNGALVMSLFVMATLMTYIKFHASIEKGRKVWQAADSMPIVMTVAGVLFVLFLARKFGSTQSPLHAVGKHSFAIYLAHMVPLLVAKPIFKMLGITFTDLIAALLLAATVALSLAFSALLKKAPGTALLIGK